MRCSSLISLRVLSDATNAKQMSPATVKTRKMIWKFKKITTKRNVLNTKQIPFIHLANGFSLHMHIGANALKCIQWIFKIKYLIQTKQTQTLFIHFIRLLLIHQMVLFKMNQNFCCKWDGLEKKCVMWIKLALWRPNSRIFFRLCSLVHVS